MIVEAMRRGNSVRILGLPKQLKLKFRRAVILAGEQSQSKWLAQQIRRLIRQQEKIHGDLLNALTLTEIEIIEIIQDGASDPEHMAKEMMMTQRQLAPILADLVNREILETRKQGGKTDAARGARRDLYFVTERYQSKEV